MLSSTSSILDWRKALESVGYYAPDELLAQIIGLLSLNGVKCALLQGLPGVGKTSLGYSLAKVLDAKVIYRMGHAWLSDQDLLEGLNLPAIATGVKTVQEAMMLGTMAKAAIASQDGLTILIFDEIEKAPEKVEALLLEFLNNGKVTIDERVVAEANLDNLIVFMTTNQVRELMSATKRRLMRIWMKFLPPKVEIEIIQKRTTCSRQLATFLVRVAGILRMQVQDAPSLEELVRCIEALKPFKELSPSELVSAVAKGFLVKNEDDWKIVVDSVGGRFGAALYRELQH